MATTDEAKTVTIKIKVLGSEVLHELTIPLSTSILSLKEKVAEFTQFPLESIRLIFRGRSLQNTEKLSTYKIEDGHTIIVHCSKGGQKSNNNTEDPPPPPRNLNPPPTSIPSNSNQQAEPNMLPQTPALPPLPHNSVTDFKRELSQIQHNIAILLNSAAQLQVTLTQSNSTEINESIQKYATDTRQYLLNTVNKIQSLQNTRFVTNNNRVEVDNNSSNTNNANQPNIGTGSSSVENNNTSQNSVNNNNSNQNTQQQQSRPVVDDIFTPNDKAFIQNQISSLNDYVENNELDESYSTTDIYKQLK
ncbi:hypothetical protein M9Y10_046095 [Tritrichomonas musculus]|uniref:Ubiquitin-like domain-containing protein n=1 Tax=Tritrichomonas musculus TaxID=1915356 RepID=A0ABR2JX50_9EUKA